MGEKRPTHIDSIIMKKAKCKKELSRLRTAYELPAEVRALEEKTKPVKAKAAPERPRFVLSAQDRYSWCQKCQAVGGDLGAEDAAFASEFEAGLSPEDREYWEAKKIYG